MENDILEALTDLGYEGPLLDENNLINALQEGPKSLDFTKLVHILAEELKSLCNLDESVNMMNDPTESSAFLLELSSFLKELGCPYTKLVLGHLSSRIQSKDDAMLLLDYLLSELMAARMVNIDKPKDIGSSMEIVMQESPTAKDLKDILITLKFNKPPPNITLEMLFSKLESKLKDTIQKEGEQLVGKPIYNKAITEQQWRALEGSYIEMLEEYRLRREMLLARLDCTVLSFEWSDRLKKRKDELQTLYRPLRNKLKVKPDVKLSDFLAARTSLYSIEKTSGVNVRKNTQSDVAKVIIGRVPDRGGRPNEQQPPPPEMPPWQQRQAVSGGAPPGRGGPRGGGGVGGGRGGGPGGRGGGPPGRGGGGRVQGGYSHGAGPRGDVPAHMNSNNAPQSQPQRNYQTYEVPAGGYSSHNYNNQQGGYNNQQSYRGGGGRGGNYNNNQDFNNHAYNNTASYNNQGGGSFNNQGYKSNQGSAGFNRGGYQNEHDDRDRRGRSSYNRGGRR